MMRPSHALIWSAFNQSWPALLIQIAGVVGAVFILDLAIDPGIDSQALINATDMVFIVSLTFLYLAALNRRQNSGPGSSSAGFPYRREFSQPVATSSLTFVPLFFFCALTQVALFVPGIVVNLLFLDVEISFLPISFALFQFTIFPLMLAWWTQNGLALLIGWIVTFILYWYGLLIPEFTRVENTWILEANSATGYIMPLLCTSAMLVVTYFGVKLQRSGDTLMELGKDRSTELETEILRDRFPIPIAQCPTESPLKAELWKERQLNGEYHAVYGGILGAGINLALLSIMDFFVPGGDKWEFGKVMILTLVLYFAVCVGFTVSMFGLRLRNGAASASVHAKTIPLGTAQLTLIRVSVALLNTLIAGCVMATIVWLLGPFLIESFREMSVLFLESFTSLAETGFTGGMLRIVLVLLAFLTGLVLFAIFQTWLMLHERKAGIGMALICAYAFLVVYGLTALFGQGEDSDLILETVTRSHLWILILSIPAVTVIMLRRLLLDWVINKTQIMWMLLIGCALQGLNLLWLFGTNNYDALNLDITITTLSYLIMQGFLPLLAVVFALWTTNRIRHG